MKRTKAGLKFVRGFKKPKLEDQVKAVGQDFDQVWTNPKDPNFEPIPEPQEFTKSMLWFFWEIAK